MPDQPKQGTFDPQKSGQAAPAPEQPAESQEDKELAQFLMKEHGHTKESAEHEVKRDREGIRRKKKEHDEQHKHGGR